MQIRMSTRKSQKPNETNFNCNHNKCGTFVLKSNNSKNIERCQTAAEYLLLINYAHVPKQNETEYLALKTKMQSHD